MQRGPWIREEDDARRPGTVIATTKVEIAPTRLLQRPDDGQRADDDGDGPRDERGARLQLVHAEVLAEDGGHDARSPRPRRGSR